MVKTMAGEYTPFEAWFYDTIIAAGVVATFDRVLPTLLADFPAGAKVLDVGCGGGQLLLAMAARQPDWRLTGLDLSDGQVKRARARAAGAGAGVDFVQGSALDLPFADDTFDGVVSVASIKHWPDPARGLAEIYRVLKPGGTMLVFEVDRGCNIDDARAFVGGMRLPAPMREVGVSLFRTYVAGQSQDIEDARALAGGLPRGTARAERVPNMPAFVITATKPKRQTKPKRRRLRRAA